MSSALIKRSLQGNSETEVSMAGVVLRKEQKEGSPYRPILHVSSQGHAWRAPTCVARLSEVPQAMHKGAVEDYRDSKHGPWRACTVSLPEGEPRGELVAQGWQI